MATVGSISAVNRWIARAMPVILSACVGFASYVTTERICRQFLIASQKQLAAGIAIIVLLYVLLTMMVACYLRTYITIQVNPGVVPYPRGIEPTPSRSGPSACCVASADPEAAGPPRDPDCPGLEIFYTKDIFICERDGRPVWCSACRNWKPDRAHHSSELNRCIFKMDHYCPWVGGIVSQTSFKFFVQFNFYTALYCALVLAAAAYTISQEVSDGIYLDGLVIGALAMGAFFGLFTGVMTITSVRFILMNLTNVDYMRRKHQQYWVAIRIPKGSPSTEHYHTVTYPLPHEGDRQKPSHQTGDSDSTSASGSGSGASASAPAAAAAPAGQPSATGGKPEQQQQQSPLAQRTFAIVSTHPGENLWDMDGYRNWLSIMGWSFADWLLPIRDSPCCHEESETSFYWMNWVVDRLKRRYGLPPLSPGDTDYSRIRHDEFEMSEI